jgi:hypothetical protein
MSCYSLFVVEVSRNVSESSTVRVLPSAVFPLNKEPTVVAASALVLAVS